MRRIILSVAMFVMTAEFINVSAQDGVVDTAQMDAVDSVREAVADDVETMAVDTVQAAVTDIDETVATDTVETPVVDTVETIALDTVSTDIEQPQVDTVAAALPDVVSPDVAERQKYGGTDQHSMRGVYLFSLRPEFTVVFGEINSVGVIGEIGMVDNNGLFLSLDVSGGVNYFGAGLNIGHSFKSNSDVKHALGYSFGYYNTNIVVKFESESGKLLKRYVGSNAGVTGLFWKVKWGKSGHIDLTNRVMFGYKSDAAWYNENDGIYTENGFTVGYSVSAGYTFVRRNKI